MTFYKDTVTHRHEIPDWVSSGEALELLRNGRTGEGSDVVSGKEVLRVSKGKRAEEVQGCTAVSCTFYKVE